MDFNSIFKYGGKVDVLIRSAVPQNIGDKSFGAGEPYTLIKNTTLNFSYGQSDKQVSKLGTLLYDNNNYPDSITLHAVPLTEKISKLIFKECGEATLKSYTEYFTAQNGRIYLHHPEAFNLYVYNEDGSTMIGFAEHSENEVTSDNFVDGNKYLCFYEYAVDPDMSKSFNLDTPDFGYFTLNIWGEGNTDDNGGSIYLKLDKCSLKTGKELYFDNAGSNTVNLTFKIVSDDSRKYDKNYFIIE